MTRAMLGRARTVVDLHVVADVVPECTFAALRELGLEPRSVLGGDPRVRMQHLLSRKFGGLAAADDFYDLVLGTLTRCHGFVGYIEEEVVGCDAPVGAHRLLSGGGQRENCCPQLDLRPCPPGVFKSSDVHATAVNLREDVRSQLLEGGFLHLRLARARGPTEVFTVQAEDPRRGVALLRSLRQFLAQSDGFEGYLKYETTRRIQAFGKALPPLVLREPESLGA